jgi:hypothetical protein
MNSTNALSPVGTLYDSVLPYMLVGGSSLNRVYIHNTSVSVDVANVWSVMTATSWRLGSETRYNFSLLLVNANLTDSIAVDPYDVIPGDESSGKVVNWDVTLSAPVVTSTSPYFLTSYTIPPNGMLLLNGACVTGTGIHCTWPGDSPNLPVDTRSQAESTIFSAPPVHAVARAKSLVD